MSFNIWTDCPRVPITQLLEFIVDNRGKTVPTAPTGHKLIATNCVTNNTLFPVYEKVRYLSDETYRTWFRAHPLPGDILFVNKGTPGRVCMVPDPVDFCIAQDMIALRADDSKIYNKYLFAVLRSSEIQKQIYNTNVGDVIPHFKKQFMDQLLIPVPEKKIQEAVGDLYYSLSYKIEHNKKINDNLLEQLDALYQELSARATWSIVPIGDLADKVAMGPFGSNIKVSTFVASGVPIISGNHLRGYFLEEPSYNYITEEHAEKLKNSIVYSGDIIFTHAGNIGQVALIPDECDYPRYVLSQRQFYLRCNKEKVLPEYVTLFFHSAEGQHELLSFANQTGVPSLAQPASNLKKITLPVPPIQIQEEWAALVRPLIFYYQRNRLESRELAILRDTLLPKLMSGEIDVSNIGN